MSTRRARRASPRCSCARWRAAGAGCRAPRRPRAPAACGAGRSVAGARGRAARAAAAACRPPARGLRASAPTSSRQSWPEPARAPSACARRCTCGTTGPRSSTAKSSRGCSVRPWLQVVAVVDDVDAADEGHRVVDHAQLVVQAPQLRAAAARPTSGRAGGTRRAARRRRPASPCRRGSVAMRAEAVDHHVHRDAAPRRGAQRLGDGRAGLVVVEDVGGQPDLRAARRPMAALHGREELVAALQQAARGCRRRSRRTRPIASAGSAHRLGQLQLGHQRQVVRHARPGGAARHRGRAAGAGRACRCGPCANTGTRDGKVSRCALRSGGERGALQAQLAHRRVELFAPVVEVAGHDQQLVRRHLGARGSRPGAAPGARGCGAPARSAPPPHAAAAPFQRTGTCSRPRCSKRWSLTSWWPMSPSGQRDSSALPCSPWRVTALVR